jgi:hypothetical protein
MFSKAIAPCLLGGSFSRKAGIYGKYEPFPIFQSSSGEMKENAGITRVRTSEGETEGGKRERERKRERELCQTQSFYGKLQSL